LSAVAITEEQQPSRRLVIIGLDGADHRLTEELIKEGSLQHLSAMGASGCFSPLKSSIPPQTAPGWTSLTTGVNPGKHGIYYFYNFSHSPLTITNAADTSAPRIWDYVEAAHGRSVVVNVPITYPAKEMLGTMVSGIPPWYLDERSVYPASLYGKLRAMKYEIDAPMSRSLEKRPRDLMARLIETADRRVEVFLDLLKKNDWTFGMIVITALDRLQHHLMGEGAEEDEVVRQGYREVDRLVGRVVDAIGEGVNYMVVSDHGFNTRPVAFYPNAWLYRNGFLRRKSSLRFKLTGKAHALVDGHLLWLPQRLTKRFQGGRTVVHTIDAVDLERSRAFVPGTDGVVVVKAPEDEQSILSGLSGIRDQAGSEVCRVYRRDQVFKGTRLDAAPELLIIPREDINILADPFSRDVVSTKGNFPKANHGPNGIFFAAGPAIRTTGSVSVTLEDVAPTALRLLDLRPPDTMDGAPLTDIMKEPLRGLVPLSDVARPPRSFAFSEAEEKSVMERLENLGYI
jgi:predicted AlkP superfamily phosphohydrolase/phosphomutase